MPDNGHITCHPHYPNDFPCDTCKRFVLLAYRHLAAGGRLVFEGHLKGRIFAAVQAAISFVMSRNIAATHKPSFGTWRRH